MKIRTLRQSVLSCVICFWIIQNMKAQSPQLIKDINPGSSHSTPLYLTAYQNGVFFIADDGIHGQEPWISNGTEAGTYMLKDIYPGNNEPFYARNPLVVDNLIFFIGNDGINGGELWVSDGTTDGTKMLKDLYPGITSSMLDLSYMVEMEGMVYFAPREGGGGIPGTRGRELWKTDGTTEGTIIVKDIMEGTNSSLVNHLVATDDRVYFAAQNDEFGNELWVSDGTEEGTFMLSNINEGSAFSNPENLTVAGMYIYFFADDGIHGRELWRTDGTGDGTIMVKDIRPGDGDSNSDYILGTGSGLVFFNADDGVNGDELWVSSGPENTVLIDINPGAGDSGPRFFTQAGTKVLFSATENEFGRELWMTDGTVAGTKLAANISEGNSSSFPDNFIASANVVYLSSNQGIWRSDGTESGTLGVTNRDQGVDNILEIAISNDIIFFSGNGFDVEGEVLGKELFKITDVTSGSGSPDQGKQNTDISIYPNPNSGNIKINMPLEYSGRHLPFTVYNYAGEQVLSGVLATDNLDLSMLSTGIYVVKIDIDQEAFREKIAVVK